MVTGLVVGALVVGALLATFLIKKPQQEGMSANTLESFSTTSSNEGSVVNVVMGRAKVTGNLLWFGNLITEAIPAEGGGGKGGDEPPEGASGYKYYMDIWEGICIGPGVSIEKLWEQNKEIENTGYTLNPGDELTYPTQAGIYAAPLNPMAHIFMERRFIGENVSFLPTYHFLINKLSSAPMTYANMTYGVNPAAAIYDILALGGGTSSDIVLSTFQDAATYWNSKNYAVNIVINKQEQVRDIINRIFTYVDGNIRYDDEGLMELVAWTDDDEFIDTLDEDDYKSFTFKRSTWDNVPTDFRANFVDREQEYTTRTIRARNTAAAAISGQDEPMSIDLTAFIDMDMASRRLWELMKRLSYPSAQVKCTVSMAHSAVREGDVVRLNHIDYGLANADFRVVKVELAENTSNDINWELNQELSSLFDADYQSGGGPAWEIPDYSPVIALAVGVFEMPYNNQTGQPPAYLMLVARAGAETFFNAYYSPTATGYENKGSFSTFSQKGTLAEAYTDDTYAIDDDIGILYTPERDDPMFDTITRAGLFTSKRVAIIGTEMIGFEKVEIEGAGYRLKGCIRGILNTPITTHSINSIIWLTEINDNVLLDIKTSSFYLKLSPGFGGDVVDISTISGINVVYTEKAVTPWGIAGMGAVRVGSAVSITIENTTQLVPGAGVLPADSSPIIHPNSFDGVTQYWTNYDATVREVVGGVVDLTYASAMNFYSRQYLEGRVSPSVRLDIAALDGNYATDRTNNTGLEHVLWGTQGWVDIMNRNTTRLNDELLTVSALLDVNDAGVIDADVLIWDAGTQKFIPGTSSFTTTTTTTTTTTSTTSSTSTSSSTSTTASSTSTSSTVSTTSSTYPGQTSTSTSTTTSSTASTTSTSTSTTTSTTTAPLFVYSAKSVILDVTNNWGDPSFMGMRSIDFYIAGVLIDNVTTTDFVAYANSAHGSYPPAFAFDTTLSKIGTQTGTCWLTNGRPNLNRLICVFNSVTDFDEIRVSNFHTSGGSTIRGCQDTRIYISDDAITDTVYDNPIANSETIWAGTLDQHNAVNEADEQTLNLGYATTTTSSTTTTTTSTSTTTTTVQPPPSVFAKSVVFEIAESWYEIDRTSVRQIDFMYLGEKILQVPITDFVAYATSENSYQYAAGMAFDTDTLKTGAQLNNQWLTAASRGRRQRLTCVFNTAQNFDEIRVNNSHSAGSSTNRGARYVKIHISTDAITSVVYGEAIPNSQQIWDGEWPQHIVGNVEDEFTVTLNQFTPSTTTTTLPPTSTTSTSTTTSSSTSTTTSSSTSTSTTAVPPTSYSAKSVILDVADSWDEAAFFYLGIRQIDFWYQGAKLPIVEADVTVTYTGTERNQYDSWRAFDTLASKVGTYYTSWATYQFSAHPCNQRLTCVFDTAIDFDEIRINNYHYNGGQTLTGAKDVKITISDDLITSVVYDEAVANSTLIFDGTFDEHIASNVEDEQILVIGEIIPAAPATTWNPSDKNVNITLSDSDRLATNGADGYNGARAFGAKSTGKHYLEFEMGTINSSFSFFGAGTSASSLSLKVGEEITSWAQKASGLKYHNSLELSYGVAIATGDILGMALDADTGKIYWSKNGTWQNSGDPVAGTGFAYDDVSGGVLPMGVAYVNGNSFKLVASVADCTYTPPTGFDYWTDEDE